MKLQFLNIIGLNTFLNKSTETFAAASAVAEVDAATSTYVLNIDYANTLAFNTKEIVDQEDA